MNTFKHSGCIFLAISCDNNQVNEKVLNMFEVKRPWCTTKYIIFLLGSSHLIKLLRNQITENSIEFVTSSTLVPKKI